MTAKLVSLHNPLFSCFLMQMPMQVKKFSDLPNWFITVGEAETDRAVRLYLQIAHDRAKTQVNLVDCMALMDTVKPILKNQDFIRLIGTKLVLNPRHKKAPNESENYRTGKEFYNFFQRRGRHVQTCIEAAQTYREPLTLTPSRQITPITLGLDSDVLFKTAPSRSAFKRNYKCISGSVTILDQLHYFELSHPIFDLSLMMTGGDARKNITQGLRLAFPFMAAANAIKNWTFDNQVQGK